MVNRRSAPGSLAPPSVNPKARKMVRKFQGPEGISPYSLFRKAGRRVCVCAHVHEYAHVCIHVYAHTYACVCMHAHLRERAYAHVHAAVPLEMVPDSQCCQKYGEGYEV